MTLRVAELFAGIGGFRVGFEAANKKLKDDAFSVVWSNQWEPGEKAQHASRVYVHRFGDKGHSNEDVSTVDPKRLPTFDILVGGFPCQDYSVAKPKNQSTGLEGKKGVLWWDIHRFLASRRPKMALLENVDRLLNSPAVQRGRDFAVMLASLNDLGYAVEWRVINAADYGFAQRRRRIFIVAHKKGTEGYRRIRRGQEEALLDTGLIALSFPARAEESLLGSTESFELVGQVWELSSSFDSASPQVSPFRNGGTAIDRNVVTAKLTPLHRGKSRTLGDVLVPESEVPDEYYVTDAELSSWAELKGAKSLMRTKKNGIKYKYAEGAMAFPDPLDRPARTIITSEGGRTPSRFKHVIRTSDGRFRRLVPTELERLSGFPKNHTRLDGISDTRRAFFIGNALVTGLITQFASTIKRNGFL